LLYVVSKYTDAKLHGTEFLSGAPDTHVIQATIKLGIIDVECKNSTKISSKVNEAWREILKDTDLSLIDLHTPLWLWSRNGFQDLGDKKGSE